MIDELAAIAHDCDLTIPAAWRLPIAIIGTGKIMAGAHLPAYRKAGLKIVGAYDVDATKARQFAHQHSVPRTYDSVEQLCADSGVKVVDIAVPPWEQPDVVHRLVDGGKHIVAQKPLAPTSVHWDRCAPGACRRNGR